MDIAYDILVGILSNWLYALSIGVLAWFAYWCKRSKSRKTPTAVSSIHGVKPFEFLKSLGVEICFDNPIPPTRLTIKVHKDAKLETDGYIQDAFDQLNRQRASKGKMSHYANPRFRIILPLKIERHNDRITYLLDVAEMDFVFLALLNDQEVDRETKQYVRDRIQESGKQLSHEFKSDHLRFNVYSKGLLGIQMVLITEDGYTLLRKRGKNVLENPKVWDVSFSGYCGIDAIAEEEQNLDIAKTIKRELEMEIGSLTADPREVWLTGLHWSDKSETVVILGYCKIQATRDDVASFINQKFARYRNKTKPFPTTKKATEQFVSDTENLMPRFDSESISKELLQIKENGRSIPLLPAAHASLILALKAEGKSTSELEDFFANR